MLKTRLVYLILFVFALGILSSCTQTTPEYAVTHTHTLDGTLRPYPSSTPSLTPLPTDYVAPTSSPTITPTATPVYYQVQDGDDMYGIAFWYGISPQEIMTANPTVNPRMMGPGTTLLIPVTPVPGATATATLALTPTPTELYKRINIPDCYPDAAGGLWCFVLVENREGGALENVSAEVVLKEGEETRNQIALMPLNLLPAGETLPLVTYFEAPVNEDYVVSAEVDFILPVMPDDQRYLTVSLNDFSIEISDDGTQAVLSSTAVVPEAAKYLWVNATAYDSAGHVVAVRRWDQTEQISAGQQISFELTLYSLGEAIDRVEVLAEAPVLQVPDSED